MARADLIKKLFSSYVNDDREFFYKIANEIIEDERKKNHGILADDLKMIINRGSSNNAYKHLMSTMTPKDSSKETPLVEILYPEKNFDDIILTKDKSFQLEQIIREYNNWDILMSNGVTPTKRVLFYGPPGCGKTISALAVASELGIPLLYVRFDALISSYLGETASNIRKVFDYAQNDSFVIFFDEFDAIGRSRNDVSEHGEIKRVVNAFLQQIDNFRGRSIIIAATNFEQCLDYAIWRRFDETILFDLPTTDEKIRLFEHNLKTFKGPVHAFKSYINDTENFSHSDIEKLSQNIMKQCILAGKRIYTKREIEIAVIKQKSLVSLRKTQY